MALKGPFTMCDEQVARALRACLPMFFPMVIGASALVIITHVVAKQPRA